MLALVDRAPIWPPTPARADASQFRDDNQIQKHILFRCRLRERAASFLLRRRLNGLLVCLRHPAGKDLTLPRGPSCSWSLFFWNRGHPQLSLRRG